jgi:hypothetical protein
LSSKAFIWYDKVCVGIVVLQSQIPNLWADHCAVLTVEKTYVHAKIAAMYALQAARKARPKNPPKRTGRIFVTGFP